MPAPVFQLLCWTAVLFKVLSWKIKNAFFMFYVFYALFTSITSLLQYRTVQPIVLVGNLG